MAPQQQKKSLTFEDEPDDGVSVADSVLSSNGSVTQEEDDVECEHERIKKQIVNKKDVRAVWRLRVVVLLVLVATATAVCALIFSITTTGDGDDFEAQYRTNAIKVVKSFDEVLTKIKIISQLALAETAHGNDHTGNWPFVTLSSFQERARASIEQSKALYVSISPLVAANQWAAWEAFVQDPDQNYWM